MNSFLEKFASLPNELQKEIIRFLFPNWFGAKIKFLNFTGSYLNSNYCPKYLIGHVDGRKILNEQGLFLSRIRKTRIRKTDGRHTYIFRYYITKESNRYRTYCPAHPGRCNGFCMSFGDIWCKDRDFKSKPLGTKLLYALYQLYHVPFNFSEAIF